MHPAARRTFDGDWESRWVTGAAGDKELGAWEHTAGDYYGGEEAAAKGIMTSEDMRHYFLATKTDSFSNKGTDLVIQYSLKYTKTPLFTMNSMYNFGEWEMLAPITKQSFPPDTTAPPSDWAACWPGTGGLTAASFRQCNSTQKEIIAAHLKTFEAALAPVMDPASPHGGWLSACPSMHCQTGFAPDVRINGTNVGSQHAHDIVTDTVVVVDKINGWRP